MTATQVDDLVAEYVVAAERGDAPDPAEWLARHPEHAAELAAFLADFSRFAPLLGLSDGDKTIDYRSVGTDDGVRFGGYELLDKLGEGGMGTVYRARPAGTTLAVALKQIRPGGTARHFREEVEAAAALRHPNIVPIYHVGEQADPATGALRPFYTMALIEGGGLDQHLARFKDDPVAAATLVAKVARAVHHAHQRRVLHRDLKPANILLDAAGEPHVADFGLAARLDDAGVAAGERGGSLPWMAPEAVRGDAALTTAIDVWALGVVLYELLTGSRPFGGATRPEVETAILTRDPVPPRQLNPRLSRDLEAVCLKCLEKDPDKRYESASAVALDLERWLRGDEVRARRLGPWARAWRQVTRSPEVAAGVALVVGVLAAAAVAGLSLAHDQEAALRKAVCQSNEYAACLAAEAVLGKLEEIGDAVLAAADDPDLAAACLADDWAAARAVLARRLGPVARLTTGLVQQPNGRVEVYWVRVGPEEEAGKDFSPRDYFQGARRRADEIERERDRVHVSRVFESAIDHRDKIALSVPFWPTGRAGPAWVLAATVTTDSTLGLDTLHGRGHNALLLAPRDPAAVPGKAAAKPGYVLLVHPAFATGEKSVAFPAGAPGPIPPPDGEPELRRVVRPAPTLTDPLLDDPAATAGHPEYEGKWLAGAARVGNTELVVLVQQRYRDAVGRYVDFYFRFLGWAGGAIVVAMVAFVAVRLLRRRRG